jgi:hypothetical protein
LNINAEVVCEDRNLPFLQALDTVIMTVSIYKKTYRKKRGYCVKDG